MVLRSGILAANRRRVDGPEPPSGQHRYWRLTNMNNVGSTASLQIAELEFRDTIGGSSIATGGTALASGGTPSNAFDGNPASVWLGVNNLASFIGYDFGTPVFVREFAIRPGTSVTDGRTPFRFDLQWSDDGVTWTNHCRRIHRMMDSSKLYAFPANGTAYRILGTSGSGLEARWAELRLSETVGGPNVAEDALLISAEGGVTQTLPAVLNTALLFDGLTDAYIAATNFYFYFGGAMSLAEIAFVSVNLSSHVAAFDLQKSVDGGFNWTSEISGSGIPRPSNNSTWYTFP